MKSPQEMLASYKSRIVKMREQKVPSKEIKPLDMTELLYLKAVLHPTNKKASKDMTRALIIFICDREIVTAEEIYAEYGWSDKPVMKRIKTLKEFGILKREAKKYYIGTPRLKELRTKYLERVCN